MSGSTSLLSPCSTRRRLTFSVLFAGSSLLVRFHVAWVTCNFLRYFVYSAFKLTETAHVCTAGRRKKRSDRHSQWKTYCELGVGQGEGTWIFILYPRMDVDVEKADPCAAIYMLSQLTAGFRILLRVVGLQNFLPADSVLLFMPRCNPI